MDKTQRDGAVGNPRIPRVQKALDSTEDEAVIDCILMLEELLCDSNYLKDKYFEEKQSLLTMNIIDKFKFTFLGFNHYFKTK